LLKSKLKFIIDNYWMPNSFGKPEEMKKISYLICALFNEEDDEDVEILKEIEEDLEGMTREKKSQTENIMTELRKIRNRLAAIEQSQ
jgi:hypothetical protein